MPQAGIATSRSCVLDTPEKETKLRVFSDLKHFIANAIPKAQDRIRSEGYYAKKCKAAWGGWTVESGRTLGRRGGVLR